jgi:hypothetical protein
LVKAIVLDLLTNLTLHCIGKEKMSSLAFETCFLKKGHGVKTLAKILLYQLNFVNAERLYNVRKHAVSSNYLSFPKNKVNGSLVQNSLLTIFTLI